VEAASTLVFADASRSDSLWNKAKEVVKEKVGSASIDVMIKVLTGLISGQLGLS